jgi:Xaa-Pro aminopeptidase
VHEAPALGRGGLDALIAGDVIAVEPSVTDPAHGKFRVEDLLVVTSGGAENLTADFPYGLTP